MLLAINSRRRLPLMLLSTLVLWAWAARPQAQPEAKGADTVTLWYFQPLMKQRFRGEVITLALSYSREQKPYLVTKPWPKPLTEQRAVQLMRQGEHALFGSLASHSLFEMPELVRLKRSALAGMLGLRLLLVRKDDEPRLAQIETIEQLRAQFSLGFGRYWRDYSILQSNGFRVTGISQFQNLFPMLEAKRFDAIPRGLNEVFKEQHHWRGRHEQITVAKNLALYYHYPTYMHMHRNYQWVLDRVEWGIQKALADGSLRALYLKHFGAEIAWLAQNKPRLIELDNPYATEPPQPQMLCSWLPGYLRPQLIGADFKQCEKKARF